MDLKRILNINANEGSKVNNGAALLSLMKSKNSPESSTSMTPVSSGANVLNMLKKSSSSVMVDNSNKNAAANDLLNMLKTGPSKESIPQFDAAEQMKPSHSNASSLLSVLKQEKPQNAPVYPPNNVNAFPPQQHYPNNYGTPLMQNNQQMNMRQTPQSMGPPMYMSPNLMANQPMMMNSGMPPMQHMNQMNHMNKNPQMFMNPMMNQSPFGNNMMSPQGPIQPRIPNQNIMMNPNMNAFNNSPNGPPMRPPNVVEEPQGNENPRKALLNLLSAEQEEKQATNTNSNSLLNLLNQNKQEKAEKITSNDELFSLLNKKKNNTITTKMASMALEDSDSEYESFSTHNEASLPDETN